MINYNKIGEITTDKHLKIVEDTKNIYKTINSKFGKGYIKVLEKSQFVTELTRLKLLKKLKGKSLTLSIVPKVTLSETSRKIRSELEVITDAKRILKYCFAATNNSPKKFRFAYVSKIQNYGINILENLYKANSYRNDIPETSRLRNTCQREAYTELKMLSFFAYMAYEQKCILLKQYVYLSKLINICLERLVFWMEKDKAYHKSD